MDGPDGYGPDAVLRHARFSGLPGIIGTIGTIDITQGVLDTCTGYEPWARGPAA